MTQPPQNPFRNKIFPPSRAAHVKIQPKKKYNISPLRGKIKGGGVGGKYFTLVVVVGSLATVGKHGK